MLPKSYPVRETIPASGLARATMGLLGVSVVLDLAGIASSWMQYSLLERLGAGETFPQEVLDGNDNREQLLGFAQIGLMLLTATVFLVWMHRAYKNLETFGERDLTFTPRAAVWAWFIPFANLVRPFKAMTELWRRSDPADGEGLGSGAPGFMKAWWGVWLASNISGQFVMRSSASADTIPELLHVTATQAFSSVLSAVAGVLALIVVRDVAIRQSERGRQLTSAASATVSATALAGQ